MQVGAVEPITDEILEAIIIQLTSMERPDQLEKNLLDTLVERLLVSCALETGFQRFCRVAGKIVLLSCVSFLMGVAQPVLMFSLCTY